jgi:hypothetical protein
MVAGLSIKTTECSDWANVNLFKSVMRVRSIFFDLQLAQAGFILVVKLWPLIVSRSHEIATY